jgi:hypothetical protein
MRRRKVFLATPMYGGMCAGIYLRAIQSLSVELLKAGIPMASHYLFNESLITRARNYCADEFLRSECTHLLFIDSDIGFDAKNIFEMLAIMDHEDPENPYDVLCGPYPKKSISWEKVVQAVNKGHGDKDPTELEKFIGDFVFNPLPTGDGIIRLDQPVEILEGGTGMMMIKRTAFEKFDAKWKEQLSYRPDHVRNPYFNGHREIMGYFMDPIDKWDRGAYYKEAIERALAAYSVVDTHDDAGEILKEALAHQEPETKRHLSEDYYFCQHLRKAGGRVWLCPWMRTEHVGTFTFSGTLMDLASIGAAATADPSKMPTLNKGAETPHQAPQKPVQQSPADLIVPESKPAEA